MSYLFGVIFILLIPQAEQQDEGTTQYVTRSEWVLAQKFLQAGFENDKNHFDREWNKLDVRLLRTDAEIRKLENYTGLGYLGLIALLLSSFQWVQRKIEKRISKELEVKRRAVKAVVQEADMEYEIRTRFHLLVIATGGRENIADFLRQNLKFRHVALQTIPADATWDEALFEDMSEEDSHLVVFDHLGAAQIDGFIERSKKFAFVGYAVGPRVNVANSGRVNFANSLMTLYSRIVETAKFCRLQTDEPSGP